jgi:F-type H+-transporting ATPase subunit alpha
MAVEEQALVIYAGTSPDDFLMAVPVGQVRRFEGELLEFARTRHAALLKDMREKAELSKDIAERVTAVLREFVEIFRANLAAKGPQGQA